MRPDPSGEKEGGIWASAYIWFDWDSYRWLDVWYKRDDDMDWEADEDQQDEWLVTTTCLLRPLLNDLPPDVLAINMRASGKLLWTSRDTQYNGAKCTYYPSVDEYRLPGSAGSLPTLLRSDLTVVGRLGPGTTKVSYVCPASGQENVVASKAVGCCAYYGGIWEEIQIMVQLSPHPLVPPLDGLILEELTELGVVGFTSPLIPGHSLDKPLAGPFKLRWLRELMGLVDELNLEFGVVHQDIAPRNLFINPETDSILLFDFGWAAGIGQARHEGGGYHNTEKPARNDVKGVAFCIYAIITRDPKSRFLHLDDAKEDELEDRTRWIKHPQVELDSDVSTFYDELMAWVRKRREGPRLTHYTQAPRHIDFPVPPEPPRDEDDEGRSLIGMLGSCGTRLEAGRPVLNWQRPPLARTDKNRRLLATGKYADEEVERVPIPVPDPKRGSARRKRQ
ncbi:hypothetical protein C8A01DRAFT_47570 [Parachaetomium inaequale]|uniref:EKC/KEOPS complex subunit BUD32 n=1 Tax=Parachaetomium inaequale TaxID=2588326 RepID=A0AAN6PDB4_9PEZI|nr:hypothetical protein C8A01DRAFT_47570 [Parachaetomium inaequale]